MASVALRRSRGLLLQRWYSALAVPLTTPIDTNASPHSTRNAPEEVQVTKAQGYTVASLENHSTLSNVSVFMKAGSRYETYDQQGLTHFLRKCAFLGNDDRSALRIAREVDMVGGSMKATSTREHIIYSSNFLRGSMSTVMDTLGSVICHPQFKHWEVNGRRHTLSLDQANAQATPTTVIMEGLHQVAYRNALCNSLYCPERNFSKFSNGDLQEFVNSNFALEDTVVVGVGVNHGELVRCINGSFNPAVPRVEPGTSQAEYVGGGELRLPSNSPHTWAAIVCKGASLKGSQADMLAAGVLQHILGAEPQGYIKWGSNSTSRLTKIGSLATDSPFSASALNINYSDSGLFGIVIGCEPSDSGKLLKATMKEFSALARGEVSDEDIARAKNQLKTRYLMSTETQDTLAEDIAAQVGMKGSYTPISETLSLVDQVSKDDIVRFSRTVFGTKGSYVCHGNLSNAPRLDHLLAEVSLK